MKYEYPPKDRYTRYSKEWWREFRLLNHDKDREYHNNYDKLQYKLHPKRELDRRLRWAIANPEAVKAHNKVKIAIKSGRLIKKPCEKCQSLKTIAHHQDYSRSLEVMWLCELHHKEQHKLNRIL